MNLHSIFVRVLGVIAQLVERLHGMQEVRSSTLLSSTKKDSLKRVFFAICAKKRSYKQTPALR